MFRELTSSDYVAGFQEQNAAFYPLPSLLLSLLYFSKQPKLARAADTRRCRLAPGKEREEGSRAASAILGGATGGTDGRRRGLVL